MDVAIVRKLIDDNFSIQWCRDNFAVPTGVSNNTMTIAVANLSYLASIGDVVRERAKLAGYELQIRELDIGDIEKVIDAIYAVQEQGYYFDDEVSKKQIFRLVNEGGIEPEFKSEKLSDREIDILELICEEKTNNQIADLLCISVRTVEVHRLNLLRKTGAKNVAGLVIYAIKNGYFRIRI